MDTAVPYSTAVPVLLDLVVPGTYIEYSRTAATTSILAHACAALFVDVVSIDGCVVTAAEMPLEATCTRGHVTNCGPRS